MIQYKIIMIEIVSFFKMINGYYTCTELIPLLPELKKRKFFIEVI